MNKRILVSIPIILVVALVFFNSLQGENGVYLKEIKKFQNDRADFLKNSEQSPFKQKNQPFKSLAFYSISSQYKVNAILEKLSKRELVEIKKSDGSTQKYIKYAFANFKVDDKKCRLLILKQLGFGNIFFTAFRDLTSGGETYGAGRYLDLEIGKSDKITIDFNKAYNPYCAYVAGYQCPFPPHENFLEVEIKAGEKNNE